MSNIRRQLEAWRDSYINITIRANNMLHQDKANSKAIRFLTNDYFTYLHFWSIASGKGDSEDYALLSRANTDPRYHPIAWEAVKDVPNPTDISHLDNLVKTGYDIIVQKGENPICLTFGKLDWRVQNPDYKEGDGSPEQITISTPIIFIPIKLNKLGVNYWIKPVDDEAMINPALILRYAAEGYRSFPMPTCGQWIDSATFDIEEYFTALEEHFSGSSSCKFDKNHISLDVFNYNRLCMYRDVSRHMSDIEKNPIIRAMFGEAIPSYCNPKGLDHVDPRSAFSILDSNTSQNNVIERFRAGESFVLEGPPGTGKTQTIVNMISEALMAHKKVLFVSGKMSAVTTVMKKLDMPGVSLDRHCLLIKGEGEDKKIDLTDTYGKLKSALEAPRANLDVSAYEDNVRALTDARDTLVGYNKEFYSADNSLGMSLYDIIGRMLALGYNENSAMSVDIPQSAVGLLTKEALRNTVLPLREIEKLVLAIMARFGSVEGDVWYGFRDYELTYEREREIKEFITEVNSIKSQLERVVESITGGSEELTAKVMNVLLDCPLSAIVTLLDGDIKKDLGYLYLKENLTEERRALEREVSASAIYREAAEKYYLKCTGEDGAEPRELDALLKDVAEYNSLTVTGVRAELEKLSRIVAFTETPLFRSVASDTAQLEGVIASIDTLTEARGEADEIRTKLLSQFTDDILTLEYLPLLNKFRTAWEKNLKENKKPMLFDVMHLGPIKKCCRDVTNVEFDMKGVYAILEDLDRYHRLTETAKGASGELSANGIIETVSAKDQLLVLKDYLKSYIVELAEHRASGLLFGEVSFKEHVDKKRTALENIGKAVSGIGLKVDMPVSELRLLVGDYATVRDNNRRIRETDIFKNLFPSIEKNVNTNWSSLVGMIALIERVRRDIRDENRTIAEDYEVFVKTIETLTTGGVQRYASMLVEKYEEFYNKDEWFDKSVMGNAHDASDMTIASFTKWFDHISDFNTIAEYTSYRSKVKGLDSVAYGFFKRYVAEGRREYPIDKMGDYYELALLYAYYMKKISESKFVAKMSGRDGITTVQSIMDAYSVADLRAMEFNRQILDAELYDSITRSAFGNMHNYLYSVPAGSNASVRRLFRNRSESIQELAPCIMMSVYSVSKLLEYDQYKFDVVIFDEASQIPAEDALTSLMRASKQVVIAGDPKQMPAMRYFDEKSALSHYDMDDENDAGECPSILDFIISAQNNAISYNRLDMHYRSNHESLIKYSNEHPDLYGGNLVTFPSPIARSRDFGLADISVLDMPKYQGQPIIGGGGKNVAEAEVVIELIKEHFRKYPVPTTEEEIEKYNSLGVIVFGTAQKKLLLDMMAKDPEAAKIAGITNNHVFFITPVDEVQGDEMCEMILSLTYGHDADGRITQAWGHLNRLPVALYKFNVAVTRAKDNLKFVHSIRAGDIAEGKLSYIADYIKQLEALGDTPFVSHREYNTPFVEAVGKICEAVVGKDRVVYNYGESTRSYRVPISILSADGQTVALGIMCEVDRAKEGFSVREYSRTCQSILAAHGWNNLYSTFAMQWIRNYAFEKNTLIAKLKEVL